MLKLVFNKGFYIETMGNALEEGAGHLECLHEGLHVVHLLPDIPDRPLHLPGTKLD